MHDIHGKLGVKGMSDLTRKAIKGNYDTKTPTEEEKRTYKKFGK